MARSAAPLALCLVLALMAAGPALAYQNIHLTLSPEVQAAGLRLTGGASCKHGYFAGVAAGGADMLQHTASLYGIDCNLEIAGMATLIQYNFNMVRCGKGRAGTAPVVDQNSLACAAAAPR